MSSNCKGVETTLSSLHISKPSKSSTSKAKEPRIADSWEQDADSDSSSESDAAQARQPPSAYPNAPPPTPISPTTSYAGSSSTTDIAERFSDWSPNLQSPTFERFPSDARTGGRAAAIPERRQEKTDAVAKRLIVGALGLKAPKKTEEQRAYDRAVREKEMRRRNRERDEEERRRVEAERAKVRVWED